MMAVSSLEAFDGADFEAYQECLEAYLISNNIGQAEVGITAAASSGRQEESGYDDFTDR